MLSLTLLGAAQLAAIGVAHAQVPVSPGPPVTATAAPPADDPARLPSIGLGADVGLPDGLMASLVVRPTPILRAHLGAGANSASPGFRGGVSVLPFGIGPSLTLEGGHYLAGNASGIARTLFGGLGQFASYVGKIGYTFVNTHAGLDFGGESFTFFIHGGVTYLRATLSDVHVPMETSTRADAPATTLTFREDPVLRMWTPSAKIGLIFYLQ